MLTSRNGEVYRFYCEFLMRFHNSGGNYKDNLCLTVSVMLDNTRYRDKFMHQIMVKLSYNMCKSIILNCPEKTLNTCLFYRKRAQMIFHATARPLDFVNITTTLYP